jgi:hypothetical protein
LPCPRVCLRPWLGRDRCPWPWRVRFGGPGTWAVFVGECFALGTTFRG